MDDFILYFKIYYIENRYNFHHHRVIIKSTLIAEYWNIILLLPGDSYPLNKSGM